MSPSQTNDVPASVPLLLQSDCPYTGLYATKYSVSPTAVSFSIGVREGPGQISLTLVVPCAVPSLVQSSSPCAPSSAVKNSRLCTAVSQRGVLELPIEMSLSIVVP